MAKINYGPPASNPTERPTMSHRDALGPGIIVSLSQRSAELVTSSPMTQGRQR